MTSLKRKYRQWPFSAESAQHNLKGQEWYEERAGLCRGRGVRSESLWPELGSLWPWAESSEGKGIMEREIHENEVARDLEIPPETSFCCS